MDRGRLLVVVIVAAIVGGVIGGVWGAAQPDRYESTVVLAVGPSPDLATDAEVISVVNTLDNGTIVATAAGIASSRTVRVAAIEGGGFDVGDFADYEVDSVPVLDSNLVDILVTGPDPDTTASLANAVAQQLQTRFAELYDVYRIETVTPGVSPTDSQRPSVFLLVLGGAALAGLVAAIALWVPIRQRAEPVDVEAS